MNGRNAFRMAPQLAGLRDTYPDSEDVLETVRLGREAQSVVARLWVSEGIPFAFRECPALYEMARAWLAIGLEVNPKEISIRGSGRLGYSLAADRWGEAYERERSDLDLFAVSGELFERLRRDFTRWRDDYDNGTVRPMSEREAECWANNRDGAPKNITNGFLDSWRVPNLAAYRAFCKTNNRLDRLKAKLWDTDGGPKPRKDLSLRCYKDWRSYERQTTLNLKFAANWSGNPAQE